MTIWTQTSRFDITRRVPIYPRQEAPRREARGKSRQLAKDDAMRQVTSWQRALELQRRERTDAMRKQAGLPQWQWQRMDRKNETAHP